VAKFGVMPQSIPDYLAVLGDSADGFPGVLIGRESRAMTLTRIPPRGHSEGLARLASIVGKRTRLSRIAVSTLGMDALLFRTLATLRLDAPVFYYGGDLRWKGPHPFFEEQCQPWGHRSFGAQCRH